MPYIYSTLSNDQTYTNYSKEKVNDLPVVERKVLIRGGANIIGRKELLTPLGVATHVDAADMEALKENEVFKMHVDNGFIKVSERKTDPEKVAPDMKGRDQSSQLVPGDFEKTEGPKPLTGKPTAKKAA